MKVKIVEQMVYENIEDMVRDGGHFIRRILIEERDNLIITPYEGQLHVFKGFTADHEVIEEVDIPYDLVASAEAFFTAREKFRALTGMFEDYIGEY